MRRARNRSEFARLALATAFEIPFPDGFFDVIFTSGVLIHIAPPDLPKALYESTVVPADSYGDSSTIRRSRWKSPTGVISLCCGKRIMPVSISISSTTSIPSMWSRYLTLRMQTLTACFSCPGKGPQPHFRDRVCRAREHSRRARARLNAPRCAVQHAVNRRAQEGPLVLARNPPLIGVTVQARQR